MSDIKEAPLPLRTRNLDDEFNNSLTICPECLSAIEILTINEENSIIEYRCIKENKNYIMLIKEYIEKINKCKIKNIDEVSDRCKIHKTKYICYCFDCNCHLCNECLKTRIHINHRKSNIIEIKPMEEEIDIVKDVINDYRLKLEKIKLEKKNKIIEVEKLLNNEKEKEKKILEKEDILNKEKENEELEENNKKYLYDIEEIRKKYEREMELRKEKYDKDNNNIINKYKVRKEKEEIKYKLKIEKLNIKYKKEINEYEFDKKIERLDNMLIINEMVYDTYNNNNNNYFNSLNINSLMLYYNKNEYDEKMKIKLKDKYENIIKIMLEKRNDDKKMREEKERIIRERNRIEENYKNEINELKKKISLNYIIYI